MRTLLRLLALPVLIPLVILQGAYALLFRDLEHWCSPVNERFSDWLGRR